MEKRKDILGKEPMIGDTIVFNPPYTTKGLQLGVIVGFSRAGIPEWVESDDYDLAQITNEKLTGRPGPRLDFAILNR